MRGRRKRGRNRSPNEYERLVISVVTNLSVAALFVYEPYAEKIFPYLNKILPQSHSGLPGIALILAMIVLWFMNLFLETESGSVLVGLAWMAVFLFGMIRGLVQSSGGTLAHIVGALYGWHIILLFGAFSSAYWIGGLLAIALLLAVAGSKLPLAARVVMYILIITLIIFGIWVSWRFNYPARFWEEMWSQFHSNYSDKCARSFFNYCLVHASHSPS